MGDVAIVMPFTVGQVVQLTDDASTQQIGGRVRNAGALATVVELREPFIETSVPGPWGSYAVMWHTDQVVSELARMYAEDCRSGNGPAYVSDGIPISWRTYAQQMRRRLDTADVLLLDARNAFDGSLEQMQDVGDEIEHFLGLDADGY